MKGNYTQELPEEEWRDLMTREAFDIAVKQGAFIDYDGFGYPSNGTMMDHRIHLLPSNYQTRIPEDATHVCWFNR